MIKKINMSELKVELLKGLKIVKENGCLLLVNNKGNIEFWELIQFVVFTRLIKYGILYLINKKGINMKKELFLNIIRFVNLINGLNELGYYDLDIENIIDLDNDEVDIDWLNNKNEVEIYLNDLDIFDDEKVKKLFNNIYE